MACLIFCLFLYPGLISQFSTNLQEAELVPHASECQRDTSVFNEHSNQEELLKAVLLAGLYPNLIQVHGINSSCFYGVKFIARIAECNIFISVWFPSNTCFQQHFPFLWRWRRVSWPREADSGPMVSACGLAVGQYCCTAPQSTGLNRFWKSTTADINSHLTLKLIAPLLFSEEKQSFQVACWLFSVPWSPTGMFSSETPLQFILLLCCCSQTATSQRRVGASGYSKNCNKWLMFAFSLLSTWKF